VGATTLSIKALRITTLSIMIRRIFEKLYTSRLCIVWKCWLSIDFIQFQCISLTFAFAFDAIKSLPQNFGLVRTSSKFRNFRLGNGESWKSQYRSYLMLGVSFYLCWSECHYAVCRYGECWGTTRKEGNTWELRLFKIKKKMLLMVAPKMSLN
jgi:hypothetical protein